MDTNIHMDSPTPEQVIEMLPNSEYRSLMRSADLPLYHIFTLIEKRLIDHENVIYKKNKRNLTTRAQQMLLLEYLGMMNKVNDLPNKIFQKAKVLSVLLNGDQDNIQGDLSNINKSSSYLRTEENFKFLVATFREGGLSDLAKKADAELDQIIREKAMKDQLRNR